MVATTPGRGFSLDHGGPFDRIMRRRLRPGWLVALAWGPLVLGATLRMAFGIPPNPIVLDISVHARFLVALPLLLASSSLLEAQCAGSVRMLYQGRLADPTELDRVVDRADKLRDLGWIELVLALVALAIGQLGLWGVVGPTGVVHGITQHREWSFSRIWYGTISAPLLLFLALRWLWRWTIWTYLLIRVSRIPLSALASHPDHAAGLSFLGWPVTGYTWFVASVSSVLAGAWGTQLLEHRLTVPSLGPTVALVIAAAVILGYGPLLAFTPQLYKIRRRDLYSHALFTYEYMRDFEAKWLAPDRLETPLGSPDVQSLNDIGSAFQIVLTARLTVFAPLRMKNIVIAVLVPMVPLLLTLAPLDQVIRHIAGALLPL